MLIPDELIRQGTDPMSSEYVQQIESNDAEMLPANPPTIPSDDLTINLVKGSITLEAALEEDVNIIEQAKYPELYEAFIENLWGKRGVMEDILKHHLGLRGNEYCSVLPRAKWISGSFNINIPITVDMQNKKRDFMMRCALPFKLAETHYPGTVDEKMGGELGLYVWMQNHCPEIRIPFLHGFGFSDHRQYTHIIYRPWYVRAIHWLRQLIYHPSEPGACFSAYVAHSTDLQLPAAYLILEHVGTPDSRMLSETFHLYKNDQTKKKNLFTGIAKIMLSLAQISQPVIGSFNFHTNGTITLTNRPLDAVTMIVENEGTPRVMQPNNTYTSIEPFISDFFKFHDTRFAAYRNSIYDDIDCRAEMAAKVILRGVAHHNIEPALRNGPFFLQHTDLHASNIFVDKYWNITCLIDLEFGNSRPIETLSPPYWIAGYNLDQIWQNTEEVYSVYSEFMDVFKEEETKLALKHNISLSGIMRETLASGRKWFWHSLTSINAMQHMVKRHVSPQYLPDRLLNSQSKLFSQFYDKDALAIIQSKIRDHEQYAKELMALYLIKGVKAR